MKQKIKNRPDQVVGDENESAALPFPSGKYYAFYKGRVALYAILRALGIGPGDEVIVPGFTCVVVPSAVVFCGGTPVYADIDPGTFNMTPDQVAQWISPKTRAVIVQHTFGLPADMDGIREITRSRDIPIIEDCAHSLGSRSDGRLLGSMGEAAFFSTQWSKPVTTGLGGFAIINNPRLEKKVKAIHNSFLLPDFHQRLALRIQFLAYRRLFTPQRYWKLREIYHGLSRMGLLIGSSGEEELAIEKPLNYELRMGPWQENLLSAFLKDPVALKQMNGHRKTVAETYARELGESGFKLPVSLPSAETVFLRYPIRVGNKEELLLLSKEKRVEIGDWFVSPLHPNTTHLEKVGYRLGQCPRAEKTCLEVINLPTSMNVNDEEVSRILEFIKTYAQIAK